MGIMDAAVLAMRGGFDENLSPLIRHLRWLVETGEYETTTAIADTLFGTAVETHDPRKHLLAELDRAQKLVDEALLACQQVAAEME